MFDFLKRKPPEIPWEIQMAREYFLGNGVENVDVPNVESAVATICGSVGLDYMEFLNGNISKVAWEKNND